MRWLFLLILGLSAAVSTRGDVVRVPLDLGPRIPVVKGDETSSEEVTLERRDITAAFVSMKNDLKGYPGQGYSFSLSLGTPPQNLSVLIDTGSSNFAVAGVSTPGLPTFFKKERSSTYEPLGRNVYVPYTLGSWSGPLGSDIVYIQFMPPGKRSFRADVTPISRSSEFFIPGSTWQGIVGLAFEEIARPSGDPAVPFFDSLVKQTKVKDIFSTQLCGASKVILKRTELLASGKLLEAIAKADEQLRVKTYGSFVIGGIDKSLYNGPLLYTPVRKKWYYEIVITGMTIQGKQVMSDCKEYNFDKTIVDTGTTDLRLPKRVFQAVAGMLLKSVAGKPVSSVVDINFFLGTRMICVQVGSVLLFNSFPVIKFDLALDEYRVMHLTLSPQQYLRYIGYNSGMQRDCFKYGIQEAKMGTVLGSVFLEGFYVVFDRANLRVGFAQSTCNFYGASVANSSVSGPSKFLGSGATLDCAFNQASSRNLALIEAVSIALGILCLLIFIPVIVLLARLTRRPRMRNGGDSETRPIAGDSPKSGHR